MASKNEQVYQMAQDWLIWLNTRRFLGQPPQKNILVALAEQNKTRAEAPDGIMSAESAAFNLAVNSLDDACLIPFIAIYCNFRPKPIKTLAFELGIQSPAFYDRAHSSALEVKRTTIQLVTLHGQIHREVENFFD